MSHSTPESRFSPLARVGLGATAAAGLVVFLALDPRMGERPRISDQEVAPTTTTTLTELEPAWHEHYGWDREWAQLLTSDHLQTNLGTQYEFLIGAGRCVLSIVSGNDADPNDRWFRIIQNPIMFSGEHEGVEFTTFSGLFVHDTGIRSERSYITEMALVVEGDNYWGSFGMIPGQTTVIDETHTLSIDEGESINLLPGEAGSPINEYEISSSITDYVPGRVIYIPSDSSDLVSRYCETPSVAPEDLQGRV